MRSFPFRRRKESSLEASKPYIWQEDERRVRDGSCHFSVKVILMHHVWNDLLPRVVSALSLLTFKKLLKGHIFSARCNIYISRLCYDVSVRLSVRLSVTEVHWRIIGNLGFEF